MKAEPLSNDKVTGQTNTVKARDNGRQLDGVYKQIRLIVGRLTALENAVSTLRRDVNRIDRKQYREAEQIQPSDTRHLPAVEPAISFDRARPLAPGELELLRQMGVSV